MNHKRPPETLSLRQVAKAAGVPWTTVGRWAKTGRIPRRADGHFDPSAIDAVKALDSERQDGEEESSDKGDLNLQLLRAKVSEREAIAKLRTLELRTESGELVDAGEVIADSSACISELRTRLLSIAPRVAPLVAAIPAGPRQIAEIDAKIADEINHALAALNATRFGGGE